MAIYITFFLLLLLFFPWRIDGYLNLDLKSKRLNFIVLLQGLVKLKGGFIDSERGSLIMHTSQKRASVIDKSRFNRLKLKKLDLSQIWITDVSTLLVVPYEAVWLGSLGILGAVKSLLYPIITANVGRYKQFVRLAKENDIEAYLRISIKVNIFAILFLLIKMWVKSEKR